MQILVIADPHIPVPPWNYGGAERIIDLLCNGLRDRGHKVHLIAAEGSRAYGGRLYTHHAPTPHYASRAFRKLSFQPLSLRAARSADVVITHARPDYLWALYRTNTPIIVHFHNPVVQKEVNAVLEQRARHIRFVCVSRDQVAGLSPADRFDVVYNAVSTSALPFCRAPKSPPYFVFLGRLTANKGVHLAIRAAQQAHVRLKIAGNIPNEPGAREFFDRDVKPHLRCEIEYLGPVNDREKIDLLGGAAGLLFPIQWKEPFGIVLIESLACGCPVIGWNNGAVPEIVRDRETGFIADSLDGFVESIRKVDEIDRVACRRDVERRFSAEVLVDNYLRVIERAVEG